MSEKKSLPPLVLAHMAQTMNLALRGICTVIELLDDGGTVPFIARYRKEATGNLDEVQIRAIGEHLACFRELEAACRKSFPMSLLYGAVPSDLPAPLTTQDSFLHHICVRRESMDQHNAFTRTLCVSLEFSHGCKR